MKYKNIIVDSVMHLGDLIQASTVATLLKKLYPGAKVTFLVQDGLQSALSLCQDVDDIIPYKYKSGGDVLNVFRYAKKIKAYNFDLSISLDPRVRLSAMMWLAGIPTRVGSPSVFGWKPDAARYFFNRYIDFKDYDYSSQPAAFNFQQLVLRFAGEENNPVYMKHIIPRFRNSTPDEETAIKDFLQQDNNQEQDIQNLKVAFCVNTVSSDRNWPVNNFAEIINRLLASSNAQIFFVGVKQDLERAQAILNMVEERSRVINLCGKTSLAELNALFRKLDFMLGLDNGLGHFAAASGCPTITIFATVDPGKYRPLIDTGICLKGFAEDSKLSAPPY
ncbi:MAG: glycosyltransferase family 9 protein [Phascolarctobacterium sp.]|nr:glycosyltransferase family 9 protein [Phascolarctobacterium sp.]